MQGQDVHAAGGTFDQIVDWHAPRRLADNQWGFDLASANPTRARPEWVSEQFAALVEIEGGQAVMGGEAPN
jgi:hypothetical protein